MYLTHPRTFQTKIDGIDIKFRYPTIADEITIEAKKITLSNGQYPFMSMQLTGNNAEAIRLIDAICTLSVTCSVLNEKINYIWDNFVDVEGKNFVLKCYEEFLKWRDSFRNRDEEYNKEEPKKDNTNRNNDSSLQEKV